MSGRARFMWRFYSYIKDLVLEFATELQQGGFKIDLFVAVPILLVLTVWLGFACWAASIAEARRHGPRRHFFIGLLIPVFYTIIIMFTMKVVPMPAEIKEAEEKAKAESEEAEEAADGMDGNVPNAPGAGGEAAAAPAEPDFGLAWFKRNTFDADGKPLGPWLISFDGADLKVKGISELQPNLIVVEAVGRDGQMQRMRLPYTKITGCQRLAQS